MAEIFFADAEGDKLLLPEQAFTALTTSIAKAPISIWH